MTPRVTKSVLATLAILGVLQAQAHDNVNIVLNISNIRSTVRDGEVVARGQISTLLAHSGYHVWLNAEKNGDIPNRYVLIGENNNQHKLSVIIGQNGWIPDIKGGAGIIKQTREVQAQFDIVVNGNQTVAADTYTISVQGGYLEPQ
ncbi:TPA: AfaD family invasin [Salmonella enterica]